MGAWAGDSIKTRLTSPLRRLVASGTGCGSSTVSPRMRDTETGWRGGSIICSPREDRAGPPSARGRRFGEGGGRGMKVRIDGPFPAVEPPKSPRKWGQIVRNPRVRKGHFGGFGPMNLRWMALLLALRGRTTPRASTPTRREIARCVPTSRHEWASLAMKEHSCAD